MEFNKNIAHIVYASDNKFAEILEVSMISLYENSKDMEDIIVYILNNGINEENQYKINLVSKSYHRSTPIWLEAIDISKELNMKVEMDRGSLSQYSRLFISRELPLGLSRVLYLDCDVIINKSIWELWNLSLHGKTVAALRDAFSKYYRVNIGLQPNDLMFNSGVMLIDLERWKDQQIEEKLLKFISKKKGKIQQGDQGALNAVLSYETYCFEPRFNSITIFYDFTYKDMLIYRRPPEFYTEKELKEAVENPSIIHFTTSFLSERPWVRGCRHKYAGEWVRYKKMGGWANSELHKDNRPRWKKILVYLYGFMPGKIALYTAALMQIYIRPLRTRIRI